MRNLHLQPQVDLYSQGVVGPYKKFSLAHLTKSFVRDSTHMINILKDFRNLPSDAILCALDVASLCTKIPHSECIQAISELLMVHRSPTELPHNSYVIDLQRVVSENDYIEFVGKYYHRVAGTEMATNLVPSDANIFMSCLENKYVYPHHDQYYYGKDLQVIFF